MLTISATSYLAGVALDLGIAPRTFAIGLGLIMLVPAAAWSLAPCQQPEARSQKPEG